MVIGIDPHKGSHTAAALDKAEAVLGELRVRSGAAHLCDLRGACLLETTESHDAGLTRVDAELGQDGHERRAEGWNASGDSQIYYTMRSPSSPKHEWRSRPAGPRLRSLRHPASRHSSVHFCVSRNNGGDAAIARLHLTIFALPETLGDNS